MDFSRQEELQLLVLLVAVGAMIFAVGRLRVPYPILLVLGGLALGFAPGLPELTLPPDLVLVALLPPLLYSAAFFTSLRDLRENIRAISFLAIGLVGATMLGVALVAHMWIDSFGWPEAFVIGAIVPRQYQPTITCKRRMVQDVLDTVIGAQMAVGHGFNCVASLRKRSHRPHR